MIESLNSKLKKLEREAAADAEPVKFQVYWVSVDDGQVSRKNARTGAVKRCKGSTIGIVPYVPSEASEVPQNARIRDHETVIAVPPEPEQNTMEVW